jgi:hypothetical protein
LARLNIHLFGYWNRLKNNEDSEAALKEFMKQERRAIDSKAITAFGLYVYSQKK